MNIMVGLDRGLVKQLGVLMISAYENHPKLLEKSSEGITFYVAYEDARCGKKESWRDE